MSRLLRFCPAIVALIVRVIAVSPLVHAEGEFTDEPLQQGMVITQSWSVKMDLGVFDVRNGNKKLFDEKVAESGKKKVTIPTIRNKIPAQMLITYETFDEGPADLRKAKSVEGNTYIFDNLRPANPRVLTAFGSEPPVLELALVLGANSDFLVAHPLVEPLVAGAVEKGKPFTLDEATFAKLFSALCDIGVADQGTATLTYRGLRDDLAAFNVEQTFSFKDKNKEAKIELNGELLIRPKGCRLISYKTEGTAVSNTTTNKGMKLHVTGPVKMEMKTDYEVPKETAIKVEHTRLNGTWSVIKLEAAGVKSDLTTGKRTFTFSDGKVTIKDGDKILAEALFEIDPTQTPKTIDIEFPAKDTKPNSQPTKLPGIYEFNDDSLFVCHTVGNSRRPQKLAADPEVFLVELKREVPDPK